MLSLSVRGTAEIFDPDAGLWPRHWAMLENYAQAITAVPLLRFLLNGVIVCGAIVALQIALCAPLAYALAKHDFRGRRLLLSLVIASLIIPQNALAIPLFVMARYAGVLNSYTALIVPFAVTPFGVFLLRQGFSVVPDDVVHAARLDGLSELAIVWRVMVPMAAPAVTAFALLSVVAHWNELYWPLIAVRSQELMPPALGVVAFRDDQAGSQYGVLMAASTMVVAPVVIIFLWAQRYFMDAMGAGAVK
jgi:multiple sugar transport system permease protein